MTALPPIQTNTMRDAVAGPQRTLEQRWQSLHGKAERIAVMADLAPENTDGVTINFSGRLARAEPHQCELAARAIDDIETMLEMGLTALSVVAKRDQDTAAPALALWREFYHARAAVLAALQPLAA